MATSSATTIRVAIYLRISRDATGEQLGVTRQREDCHRIAAERSWQIVAEYMDNSIDAYDKRKRRPQYEAMVDAYRIGLFDALVCWDLDRLTRQPRQLEDWIEAAEDRGLKLVTANGEADLSTDGGRMYARIKASVARAESERKAARQRRAALQRAELGRPPLGVRLAGYTPQGEIIEQEAALVRQMFERFHAGDSLRAIVAWLTDTGAPTRKGRPWSPSSVRSILTNPRYCGRSVYNRHKENSNRWTPGSWPPVIGEDVWEAVNARLEDPRRRKQIGTDRKYLGSGLFLCGVCDSPVVTHGSAAIGSRYRCRAGAHFTRSAYLIDQAVLAKIRARLAQPDVADLLTSVEGPEAKAAANEIRRLRGRLTEVERDYDADLIDGRRYKIKTEKVRAQLAAAEAAQQRLAAPSGVGGILSAADPVAAFDAASLGQQRAISAFFLTVRLYPAPRGRKGFDPTTVKIEPNHD
jgi:DNA invertase Pin-like site-specific DNA recombinase